MNDELLRLQAAIQSADWNEALAAADALAEKGPQSLTMLLPLLESANSSTCNAVALALRTIASNEAVGPLIARIQRQQQQHINDYGTLVYALETHDCSQYFLFLFKLALEDYFEAQNHALTILYEQEFRCDVETITQAQAYLLQYKQRPDRTTDSETLIADLERLLMTENPLLTELPKAWWSFDLPSYRPHPTGYATYSMFEYEKLPPILEPLNGDFAWLRNEAEKGDAIENEHCQLERILNTIDRPLPATFTQFMRSTDLQARIRSCTACYLDTADRAIQTHGTINGTLIHFLSDQQWCLHWYLLIDDAGNHGVVVSGEPYCFVFDPEEGEVNPRHNQASIDVAQADLQLCAPSFEAFMYRFWLENEIWFKLALENQPLSEQQQTYVDHYTQHQ